MVILSPPRLARKVRKHLSADALFAKVRTAFDEIPDHRREKSPIPLGDALMSAFAMFALKDPSLLAFDQRRNDTNMKRLFGIERIPSDTQMREILDPLEPDQLRPVFNTVLAQLQRGKALEAFVFHEGYYLLGLDGTGWFSSSKVHCESCLEKKNKTTGEVTYEHQMLGAVLLHPDHKEVFPLASEPIQKGCDPLRTAKLRRIAIFSASKGEAVRKIGLTKSGVPHASYGFLDQQGMEGTPQCKMLHKRSVV